MHVTRLVPFCYFIRRQVTLRQTAARMLVASGGCPQSPRAVLPLAPHVERTGVCPSRCRPVIVATALVAFVSYVLIQSTCLYGLRNGVLPRGEPRRHWHLARRRDVHAQAFLALAPPLAEALGSPAPREEAAASLRAVMAVMAANVLVDVAITALFGWS